jgi:hypothetical protein
MGFSSVYKHVASGSTASTGFEQTLWKINDWYDLDLTGFGHQPMYFDLFASIYERYVPLKGTIKVTFINKNAFPITTIVFPSANLTTPIT